MKQLLRSLIYREAYRQLRNLGSSDSNADPSQTDTKGRATPQSIGDLPIDEGPLDGPDELKTVLQQMDPYDFEQFVADLWERMGWETEVSAASADEGVDVVARKNTPYEQTTLIQAKRYGPNTTVGSPDIQQYASLDDQYDGVDTVVVVTTNTFTTQARELAARLDVKLVDGDALAGLVDEYEAADLVDKYLTFVTTVDDPPAGEASPDPDDAAHSDTETTTETRDRPGPDGDAGVPAGDASEPTTDERSGTVASRVWPTVIALAIPGWLVVLFGVDVIPSALWGIGFLAVWAALPVALFLDARALRDTGGWPRYWWVYVLTSVLWVVAIIPAAVYLWRRRSHPSRTASEQAELSER
jgi:hypothetical protein